MRGCDLGLRDSHASRLKSLQFAIGVFPATRDESSQSKEIQACVSSLRSKLSIRT